MLSGNWHLAQALFRELLLSLGYELTAVNRIASHPAYFKSYFFEVIDFFAKEYFRTVFDRNI